MDFIEALRTEDRTLVESACEARARAIYVGNQRLMCRVLTKYLMYVAAEDTSLTPHLAMSGYWEMWVTQAIVRNVRSGWRCFDVGANVGYFTLLLADLVGEDGSVVAFEPQGRLAQMIGASTRMNGFGDRVDVTCAVLGDAEGTAKLLVPGTDLGSAHVSPQASHGDLCLVTARTIDGLDTRVDFLKVDAEGAEAAILRGGAQTLARDRPILLLEYSRAMAGASEGDPVAHIRSLVEGGYRLQTVDTAGRLEATTLETLEQLPEAELAMLWLSPKS